MYNIKNQQNIIIYKYNFLVLILTYDNNIEHIIGFKQIFNPVNIILLPV